MYTMLRERRKRRRKGREGGGRDGLIGHWRGKSWTVQITSLAQAVVGGRGEIETVAVSMVTIRCYADGAG